MWEPGYHNLGVETMNPLLIIYLFFFFNEAVSSDLVWSTNSAGRMEEFGG